MEMNNDGVEKGNESLDKENNDLNVEKNEADLDMSQGDHGTNHFKNEREQPLLPQNAKNENDKTEEMQLKNSNEIPLLPSSNQKPALRNSSLAPADRTKKKKTFKNSLHSYREKWTKSDIIRNLILVGSSWFALFTAYNALEVLQSSLNPHYGVLSISLIYALKIITSLTGPLLVKKFTPKICMIFGSICHTVFILANFYPVWFTLLPAGALVGVAMGPLWICLGVYITALSVKYSEITSQPKTAVLSKFNGIIQATVPLTFFFGNLITSSILSNVRIGGDSDANNSHSGTVILSQHSNNETSLHYYNNHPDHVTYVYTTAFYEADKWTSNSYWMNNTNVKVLEDSKQCGPNYCPNITASSHGNDDRPNQGALFVMLSVLGCFNLIGVLLVTFGLDNLDPKDMDGGKQPADEKLKETESDDQLDEEEVVEEKEELLSRIKNYLLSFFNWQFLLLIPSTVYIHIMLALMGATFTKAYVTCTVGISMVGYVSMARGLTGFFTNMSSGIIGQYIDRNIIFAVAIVLTVSQLLIWFLWEWMPNQLLALFLSAAIAGIANGANLIQYTAFLGDAFTDRKTEVFSFYHFWAGIAVAVGFLQNNYVCVDIQLYVFVGIMILAIITYVQLNIYLKRDKKRQDRHITIETSVTKDGMDTSLVVEPGEVKKPTSLDFVTDDTWTPQLSPKRLQSPHKMGPKDSLLNQELRALSASQTSLSMV